MLLQEISFEPQVTLRGIKCFGQLLRTFSVRFAIAAVAVTVSAAAGKQPSRECTELQVIRSGINEGYPGDYSYSPLRRQGASKVSTIHGTHHIAPVIIKACC